MKRQTVAFNTFSEIWSAIGMAETNGWRQVAVATNVWHVPRTHALVELLTINTPENNQKLLAMLSNSVPNLDENREVVQRAFEIFIKMRNTWLDNGGSMRVVDEHVLPLRSEHYQPIVDFLDTGSGRFNDLNTYKMINAELDITFQDLSEWRELYDDRDRWIQEGYPKEVIRELMSRRKMHVGINEMFKKREEEELRGVRQLQQAEYNLGGEKLLNFLINFQRQIHLAEE